jgi:hypothetical protein
MGGKHSSRLVGSFLHGQHQLLRDELAICPLAMRTQSFDVRQLAVVGFSQAIDGAAVPEMRSRVLSWTR